MSTASPGFTPQGQYLAFIRTYSILNRRPPSEADMQRFFGPRPVKWCNNDDHLIL
jgi:hypothetical protein